MGEGRWERVKLGIYPSMVYLCRIVLLLVCPWASQI
jgi:hypothetical protein